MMPRRFAALIQRLIGVAMVWAFAVTCFAQDIDYGDYSDELNGPPKTYVPVYIIMIAFVGLALTLICRTSKRQAE